MGDSPVVERVRTLVEPIASDLGLDLYDVEQRGGTLRITLDTPPGSEGGIDMEALALATRLVSRELDHEDPVPGRYTLEVTSPGVERALRTPGHFRREIGKIVSVRLSAVEHDQRRIEGVLVAADDQAATLRYDDPETGEPVERRIDYDRIDRARTVFVWGPAPKPGKPGSKRSGSKQSRSNQSGTSSAQAAATEDGAGDRATKENQP